MSDASQLSLARCQQLIEEMYSDKDRERGSEGTFLWFMEEVGELASALREGPKEELAKEFADVLAWLLTLANVEEIDVASVFAAKYAKGCPGCGLMVCTCNEKP